MEDEKIKNMSIYIYLMHTMEKCEELNNVVKDDIKDLKKYFCTSLGVEVANVGFDAN